ncbi:MAG: thioredoxin family protein [Enhygromyxa sp.]
MTPGSPSRLVALLLGLLVWLTASSVLAAPPTWRELDEAGEARIHLYFFWTRTCAHCQEQRPIVEGIAAEHPWVVVHEHELSSDPAGAQLYVEIAESLGEQARYVPALAFCQTLIQGLVDEDTLEARLLACRDQTSRSPPSKQDSSTAVEVPLLGEVDVRRWSLPVTTVVLASLDAFNPCAFFVLLFLLSLLVRTQSRGRMLLISGIFIAVSGLWYFVFMAAWLNVFLWFGELRWMTLAAGVVAVLMAGLNIKDFFVSRGPSLSIPESAKPGLFARMRKLARASSLPSAALATVLLAAVANTYEFLCTAGLPMIYTRVLTLAELSTAGYYLYLAFYNLIYVLPLIVIVALSIKTLGKRKLQEREGRALKLLSGLMMLGLGLALMLAPELLGQVGVAVGILLGAGLITVIAMAIDRRVRPDDQAGSRPTRA